MKKRYYIAAMFALGLVAQPAILRANAADEANSIEAVQQQKQRISGLLTDSNGDPIIGATVRVQGTTNRGVISDVEGRYSIEAAPGEVLEFSYIGFVSIEHRVKLIWVNPSLLARISGILSTIPPSSIGSLST